MLAVGNALNVSPHASDSIQGLGLNAAATVDKDYILATPAVGDFIKIQSDVTAVSSWLVTEAGGTWTREA